MAGCRKQRSPSGRRDIALAGKPDRRVPDCGNGAPCVIFVPGSRLGAVLYVLKSVVNLLSIPARNTSICEGVVELSIELCGSLDILRQ